MAQRAELEITGAFASAMQQLSAEAEKTLPEDPLAQGDSSAERQILDEFRSLNQRLERFENGVAARFEKLEDEKRTSRAQEFQKIDEHLTALRNTESVNQRLFDSLHDELIKYRDNFLHESLQKPFIRDLVILFDDLSAVSSQLQQAVEGGDAKRAVVSQWRENLENAIHSLTEILHRMEVSEIEPKEKVDREFHRVMTYEPTDFADEEGRIVMRIKRGFLWRDKVLRAEEVVAKRFA